MARTLWRMNMSMQALSQPDANTAWNSYLELKDERPELFVSSSELEIIFDWKLVRNYEREHGVTIGMLYRSRFNTLLVDLVRNKDGSAFAFERLVQTATGQGVVGVPVYQGKFILLRQFRHSMRSFQYAFPRGYGENDQTAVQNVRKELSEEVGATVGEVTPLGEVVANSGISGDRVRVFKCEILSYEPKVGYEEIVDIAVLTGGEILDWLKSGRIDDGFSLSAVAFMKACGQI